MIRHLLAVLCTLAATAIAAATGDFADPKPVEIVGYQGHAMEPFISRDGRYLLFNNRNDPGENTDLHWALRLSDLSFRYGGRIEGVNTSALEGVPSLDNQGNLYFVSPRSYKDTLSTVYRAKFKDGAAGGVELVNGLSLGKPGIVTFDAEISADGQLLYGADGDFTGSNAPKSADMFVARRVGDRFERLPDSARIMANVNNLRARICSRHFTRRIGAVLYPPERRPALAQADDRAGDPQVARRPVRPVAHHRCDQRLRRGAEPQQ